MGTNGKGSYDSNYTFLIVKEDEEKFDDKP